MKLDILLSGRRGGRAVVYRPRDKAYGLARGLCDKLKEIIPRQLFEVPIQGAIGNQFVATGRQSAASDGLRRRFTAAISPRSANCSRRRGQRSAMKAIGSVEVPFQEASYGDPQGGRVGLWRF